MPAAGHVVSPIGAAAVPLTNAAIAPVRFRNLADEK
jgi:hypothetical protein